ncbi:MAG: hypothetical protein P4L99_03270 [Chthoniobacter sp.]|nr:hypothetical protein [Chthoniobacter sp.]
MTTTLRLLAIAALALSIPACASTPKKSSCCAAGDKSCQAPVTKKKAS